MDARKFQSLNLYFVGYLVPSLVLYYHYHLLFIHIKLFYVSGLENQYYLYTDDEVCKFKNYTHIPNEKPV